MGVWPTASSCASHARAWCQLQRYRTDTGQDTSGSAVSTVVGLQLFLYLLCRPNSTLCSGATQCRGAALPWAPGARTGTKPHIKRGTLCWYSIRTLTHCGTKAKAMFQGETFLRSAVDRLKDSPLAVSSHVSSTACLTSPNVPLKYCTELVDSNNHLGILWSNRSEVAKAYSYLSAARDLYKSFSEQWHKVAVVCLTVAVPSNHRLVWGFAG